MSLTPSNLQYIGTVLESGAPSSEAIAAIRRLRESNMSMDKIGDTQLYISGLFAMRRRENLEAANITHVVSVLGGGLDPKLFEGFEHLVIEVDDDEDENLIEHFRKSNEFIDKAVASGGSVLIHCAMGKSRSATIASAYLIYKFQMPPSAAIDLIRQTRPMVEPNVGFWEQLELYYNNLGDAIKNLDDVPAYQRYLYRKEVALSRAARVAPTINFYAADGEQNIASADKELKCKRCRRTLATSKSLVDHIAKPAVTATARNISGPSGGHGTCQHHFLDPIEWMRPELEKGALEGKLQCPKCDSKVGSYAWQGMKCSCGTWVTPAISLARSRVDEVRPRPVL